MTQTHDIRNVKHMLWDALAESGLVFRERSGTRDTEYFRQPARWRGQEIELDANKLATIINDYYLREQIIRERHANVLEVKQ